MAQIQLNTNNNACEVELQIHSTHQQSLRIVGYGGTKERYFDRNVVVAGNPTILRFGLPVSPKKLTVKCNNNVIIKPIINRLNSKLSFNPKINEFTDLVKEFSQNLKNYPANKYYKSRNGSYTIKHTPSIIGKNGEKETPARIHKQKHYIEVSNEWFKTFTIPMRVFVLCHEFSHIFLNIDPLSEEEADLNGAKLYLDMGFPVIELMYSFTKIFGESKQTTKRAGLIYNWLITNK